MVWCLAIRLALREVPGIEPEWYYLLHAIDEAGEVRKTDIISINLLLEPTTGIDILNRMIKAGLLKETQDVEDRRARLLRLTSKGEVTLKKAEQQVRIVIEMIFGLPMEEGWLGKIDSRFTDLLARGRPKTLEELLILARSPS